MKVMYNGKQFTQGAAGKTNPVEYVGHNNTAINEIQANPNLTREEKIVTARAILNNVKEKPIAESNSIKPNIRKIRKTVCVLANKIHSKIKNLSAVFKKAWQLIKAKTIQSKVAGVTFGKTQTALKRLTKYSPKEIKTELVREPEHENDANAIGVRVAVNESKPYKIGFLPRDLAEYLSRLLDKGITLTTKFQGVTGGTDELYYGALIEIGF